MPSKSTALLTILVLSASLVFAQDKSPYTYGKISRDDFKKAPYQLDSSAAAVVIADIGSSRFESGTEDFVQVFRCYRRIHILNKNGYDEASVTIPLHIQGTAEERLQNLKAVTYNLENGEVVETKLESKNVFTEKSDKSLILKKFTLPAVKEGSIIEYSYAINSEFAYDLRAWAFQDRDYPVLWSEYEVMLPEYFEYIFLSQGYHPFHIKDSENSRKTYNFRVASVGGATQPVTLTPGVTTHRWVMKDIAPLKEENFVTTLANHVSAIEFQLSAIRYPNSPVRPYLTTWPKFSETMLKSEHYGEDLSKNNGFLGDQVDELTKGVTSKREKAEKIYDWVRDNYTCTDYSALYTSQSLKSTFTKKNGYVSDINLLLVAMLRRADITAVPVMPSTRSHGKTYEMYPIRSKMNYTVVSVNVDDKEYYLDAARPYLGFGKLHMSAYNGHARRIDEYSYALAFEPDSLKERTVTGIFIAPNDKGELSGHFQRQLTYFESYDLRSRIKEKGETDFFNSVSKGFTSDIHLTNGKIEKLKSYTDPVTVEYDFILNNTDENGMLYLSPMFSESMRSNPFKSAVRTYPVEMPSVTDNNYTLSFQVPENFVVEEIPKSTIVKYNDGEGIFQFMVQHEGNLIQLRSRVKLNRALFAPDEYESLRDFYDMVVKKHAEQIVLKKKP